MRGAQYPEMVAISIRRDGGYSPACAPQIEIP